MSRTKYIYYALQQITGDYLIFYEGYNYYWSDKQKIQTQYDFLEQNPEYALYFHQSMNISPYHNRQNEMSKISKRNIQKKRSDQID